MRPILTLLCAVMSLAAVDVEIASVQAESWIAQPGTEVPVAIALRGPASAAVTLRAELRSLSGDVRWQHKQELRLTGGTAQARVTVATTDAALGDHGLRISVVRDGEVVSAVERVLMLALPNDLVLIFDREPIARGLSFERHHVAPEAITVGGAHTWVHQMTFGSQREAEGWWRSLYVTLTDDALRHGRRPIADIELVYQHEADAPVELAVDTARGSQTVGRGYGRQSGWQTLRAQLTDARFAAPAPTSDPKQRAAEGCDLRFNACTTDGRIRSLRIHLPDAGKPADWSRFLEATAFTSQSQWVIAPKGRDEVAMTVANRALVAWEGTAQVELCTADGRTVQKYEQSLRIPASGEASVRLPITVGEDTGEHLLRWRLRRGDQQDIGFERSLMVASAEHAFILFEREPIMRGMDFTREHVQPVEITTSGGLRRWIWTATAGSAEVGWWRSVRMHFTDDAFRNGAAPVVDIALRCRQRSDAPINLMADTARGGGEVASGWGGRGPSYDRDPPWRTLYAQVDDARFARTQHGAKPEDLHADGHDLRFNGCTVDGEIRSVVVRRHDRRDDVDWARMLRPLGVDFDRPRLLFEPGSQTTATLRIANRAAVAWKGPLDVRFTTDLGQELWQKTIDLAIAADGTTSVPIALDLRELPRGAYRLLLQAGTFVDTAVWLGVTPTAVLPKAREGEFYYGIGGIRSDPQFLDWADYMGIDFIRNLGRQGGGTGELDLHITRLRERGLRGHVMLDPAWHPDVGERRKETERRAAWLEQAARKHRDFIHWIELGNEPDLPFFYAGSIEDYLAEYAVLHAAAKRGNPQAVVMNGGLCFHGRDGWERANELVAKMPHDQIDAWAYHGHGPGATAERNAWERQKTAVTQAGGAAVPFIETESGFAAKDGSLNDLRTQARTIVQKLVYAQSKDMPFFLWYHFGNPQGSYDWGIVDDVRAPRPAALAHRAMVERLRHHRFERTIDLAAVAAEAYLFHGDDHRRAVVLWSDQGTLTRTLAIGATARALAVTDLFGNTAPLSETTPGVVQLTLDADPIFVHWRSGEPAFAVQAPPPVFDLPARLRVVPGRTATLRVGLRNPGQTDLAARLTVATTGIAPLTVDAAARALRIPVTGASEVLTLPVAAVAPSIWPHSWTVFAPVAGEVDLRQVNTIPSTLPKAQAQNGLPTDGNLDLAALGGGHDEKKQAICFAWIDSPVAQRVEFGAGADWWMEWYVNGQRVYSTLETGNQGSYSVLRHVFPVDLRAGRNLVAVRVLSGSGGWRLVAGGPDEVAAARRAEAGERDALVLHLHVGDRLLARESLPVEILRPLPVLLAGAKLVSVPPVGALGAVENRHMAQPDRSRWYQGPADLSGQVWVARDGQQVRVSVVVRDDRHLSGDRCIVRLAAGAALDRRREWPATATREDASGTTRYTLSIPVSEFGDDRCALQAQVDDDDWGELKQTALWGAGSDPEGWFQGWVE